MTRSFRPGQQSESNLTKSFGARGFGSSKLNTQRPMTAATRDNGFNERATIPAASNTHEEFGHKSAPETRQTEVPNFHPPQNEMRFLDDDEDIRQQIEELEAGSQPPAPPKKEPLDPETQRQVDDIMKHIQNLKYSSELNKRVESLIALNEIIQ